MWGATIANGQFGFGLGPIGFGNGGGLTGGFAAARGISFGPGGVQTGGFGPIGGIIPFFGRRRR